MLKGDSLSPLGSQSLDKSQVSYATQSPNHLFSQLFFHSATCSAGDSFTQPVIYTVIQPLSQLFSQRFFSFSILSSTQPAIHPISLLFSQSLIYLASYSSSYSSTHPIVQAIIHSFSDLFIHLSSYTAIHSFSELFI